AAAGAGAAPDSAPPPVQGAGALASAPPAATPTEARRPPEPAPKEPEKPVAEAPKAEKKGPDCSRPGSDYTRCFDTRPKPAILRVEVPAEADPSPTTFALWVQVTTGGQAEAVRKIGSSGNGDFDKAAQLEASRQTWTPATKGGKAVTAWTQVQVVPVE
ncbi:MAG: energy transducer TonB, partial [Gemmatimonadales bacterium]|nr:energy transducer TonB [Gemmatimonadales bacterium]